MPHNHHVVDNRHLELELFGRERLLLATQGWKDPYGLPLVCAHDMEGDAIVWSNKKIAPAGYVKAVRDDSIVGTKARFGDLLVSKIKQKTIVYVGPRVGMAGISILEVAKRYRKKVVLFMPASQQISYHQAVAIERGAIPKFRRIAAMPNLNLYAQKWAEDNNAFFVPLGLRHELVTAAGARVALNMAEVYGEPEVMFVATSTGVLIRALQVAWERTKFFAVAVARNMKPRELGRASVITEPLEFTQPERAHPAPWPSVETYDSKAAKYAFRYKQRYPKKDVWCWNVAREPTLNDLSIIERTDSSREWGEVRD